MDRLQMTQELKKALSDLDDCETKIKNDDKHRALYELSYAYDRVKKVMKALEQEAHG